MQSKIILFCGVESTGKTTSIKKIKRYLTTKNKNVKVVYECGRDISEESGGVENMSLLDYEKILFTHQQNILKALKVDNKIILLDTDSIYTAYYLEKDIQLFNSNTLLSNHLVNLSEDITKINLLNRRICKIIYLNSNCKFVQDGTRTYESTRKTDDSYLLNKYKKTYGERLIEIVDGIDFKDRMSQIKKIVDNCI